MLRIRLIRSFIGYPKRLRATLKALGLNKIGSCAVHAESDTILGMIRKAEHHVSVERLSDATEAR